MEYSCKIGTAGGRVLNQTEEATSEHELRARLESQGYYIFSVRPKQGFRAGVAGLQTRRFSSDDFMIFNQQFLTLSKSGLPLQKSLELLAGQAQRPALQGIIGAVRDKVRGGALLSEAFEAVGRFPKVYCATLRAGERSGSLDKVLAQYITYQKAARTFRKKFLSALIYPAFLLIFLAILISLVVTFIVPKFAQLYSDLEVPLPAASQLLIALSLEVKRAAAVLLVLVGLGLVALRLAWQRQAARLLWERMKLRLPVAGSLLVKFSVAEFARTLATLVQGGIPIVSALETARDSVSSPLLSKALREAQQEVLGGRALSAALRRTGFFPPIALDMVEVGETTGALASMLESLADFYEEDVQIDLSTLVALVDPIMIASIALVVGYVLVAFYMPLFSLAGQVR